MRLWTRLRSFSRAVEARYPPLGTIMQLPHGRVHYLAGGAGRDLPIVLLHGASGNLRDFALSLFPAFKAHGPVIAFDRPGFGYSDPVPEGWRLSAQIEVLRATLRRLGHDRYCLVGHSYSGALALAWALEHSREVAGIGLIAGAAMDWGGQLEFTYRIGGAPVIGPMVGRVVPLVVTRRWLDATVTQIFEPATVPSRYWSEGGIELALRPHTFQTNFRAMNRLHQQIRTNQPRYGQIRCPVEIIHGNADRIVPADVHAVPLSRLLANARLTMIPGAGHMVHHSHTDVVAATLARLAEREPGLRRPSATA